MNKNTTNDFEKPFIIEGGLSVDDRGELMFINNFDMDKVKRFYIVSNHKKGFVRAWHGHKKEEKYVTSIDGVALISTVRIDDWDDPSIDLNIDKFVLSSKKPSILYIPSGYANGFKTLSENSKLIFFSNSTIDESIDDDYRYDAYKWNPWEILER